MSSIMNWIMQMQGWVPFNFMFKTTFHSTETAQIIRHPSHNIIIPLSVRVKNTYDHWKK